MLVKLNTDAQEDLKLLADLDQQAIEHLCNVAIRLVRGEDKHHTDDGDGSSDETVILLKKWSRKLAERLQRDRSQVERAIQALAYVFASSGKAGLSDEEFQFSLFDVPQLSEQTLQTLVDTYAREKQELRRLLSMGTRAADHVDVTVGNDDKQQDADDLAVQFESGLMLGENRYQDLRWRLDLEVDSRMVRNPMPRARYLVRLDTTKSGGKNGATSNQQYFHADYQDLVHMCSTLEAALRELHSVNVRRIKTYIK